MEELILVLDHKLRTPGIPDKKVVKYLKNLSRFPITFPVLKSTKVGKTVNQLAKNSCGEAQTIAKQLLEKWKAVATDAKASNVGNSDDTTRSSKPRTDDPCKASPDFNGKSSTVTKKSIGLTSSSSFLNSLNEGLDNVSKKKRKERHQQCKNETKEESYKTSLGTPKALQSEATNAKPSLPEIPLPSVTAFSLPDITPNYYPTYHCEEDEPPSKKKKAALSEADLASSIVSRKSRTQMFSGKRSSQANGVVASLYQQSMKILCENIDAIEDTGGVPFAIMEPLLARCTPEQLMTLEEYNPYFTEDTGDLWKRHCCRQFRGREPDDMESWRELYIRLLEEREQRLQKINEKITAAQAAKLPVRQAKLAFVSSSPKPPANVRRRQEKNGTSPLKLSRRPPMKDSSSTSFRDTSMSSDSPVPVKKPVSRPMMKAAMKMFKAQRGRVNSSVMRR